MIFYSEMEFKGALKNEVQELIGDELNLLNQFKYGSKGSPKFQVKSICIEEKDFDFSSFYTTGTFERFRRGMVFRFNYRGTVYCLAFGNNEFFKIDLNGGKEEISPFLLSPMNFLLKLNLPIRFARYFKIRLDTYFVGNTFLKISLKRGNIDLESNGYNKYRIQEYFRIP